MCKALPGQAKTLAIASCAFYSLTEKEKGAARKHRISAA